MLVNFPLILSYFLVLSFYVISIVLKNNIYIYIVYKKIQSPTLSTNRNHHKSYALKIQLCQTISHHTCFTRFSSRTQWQRFQNRKKSLTLIQGRFIFFIFQKILCLSYSKKYSMLLLYLWLFKYKEIQEYKS